MIDFILYLETSIRSIAKALLISKLLSDRQKQVFLRGFFIAIDRYTGLSNSEVLVLLLYAVALYEFMCNSDWMDENKFEMVNALLWVRHCGLSC